MVQGDAGDYGTFSLSLHLMSRKGKLCGGYFLGARETRWCSKINFSGCEYYLSTFALNAALMSVEYKTCQLLKKCNKLQQ